MTDVLEIRHAGRRVQVSPGSVFVVGRDPNAGLTIAGRNAFTYIDCNMYQQTYSTNQ